MFFILLITALYLPWLFLCWAILKVDIGTFLVSENKSCWHWYKVLFVQVWSSGRTEGSGQGQCWLRGAVSKRGLGKSQSPISAWCSGFTLVWACISVQQRKSRSLALGECQDIEADSWRCQPGSLHKETATVGLILVVWQKQSSALFSTNWISPNDFSIHIKNLSS